jgi:hypothetical protein
MGLDDEAVLRINCGFYIVYDGLLMGTLVSENTKQRGVKRCGSTLP